MTTATSTAFKKTAKGIRLLTEQPTLEDYIATFENLHTAHDAVQWCLGDMVLFGREFWPEESWQIWDQYAPGYLDNVARTCSLFDLECRHNFEVVSFSIFRAITCPAWLEHEDRIFALNNAAHLGWTVARIQDWKREYWTSIYPELPYTSTNARDPDAALARLEEIQAPDETKQQKPLARLRYYVGQLRAVIDDAPGETVLRLDVSLLVAEIEVILKELKA